MKLPRALFCGTFLSVAFATGATHLRAVEITAHRIDCLSNTYEITITAYLQSGSLTVLM